LNTVNSRGEGARNREGNDGSTGLGNPENPIGWKEFQLRLSLSSKLLGDDSLSHVKSFFDHQHVCPAPAKGEKKGKVGRAYLIHKGNKEFSKKARMATGLARYSYSTGHWNGGEDQK